MESDDFRPIAILPVLSKIYERLVLKQLLLYIEDHNILHSGMSGFRKGHSINSVLLRIRDDIIRAMKKGEVTLIAFADFSKAFDTVEYASVFKKLHNVGFSHDAVFWVLNYLTGRKQYVQINEKQSQAVDVQFGVPQGSVLGPVLFDLYVSDLEPDLECSCYQYADDTTLYRHSAPSKIHECAKKRQDAMTVLENWAAESNLALNETKTKQMLITTSKMSRVHGLDTVVPDTRVKAQTIEKVEEFKLLGTWFRDNLKWGCHIKHVTSSCYAVLSTLKKLRNLTSSHIKKQLAESLILPKIYHNIVAYHPLPAFQLKKLQRVQNAAASFVTNKYCRIGDVLSLGWLPIHEKTELELMRFANKAIWDHSWPQYLRLELRTNNRLLRSSNVPLLKVPLETGTFQDCCAKIFNELPTQLRNVHDHRSFLNTLKSLLLNKTRDRIEHL